MRQAIQLACAVQSNMRQELHSLHHVQTHLKRLMSICSQTQGQSMLAGAPESHQLNTVHAHRGLPRMRPQSSSCTRRAPSDPRKLRPLARQGTDRAAHGCCAPPVNEQNRDQRRQDRTQQTRRDEKRQSLTGMLDRQRLPTPTERTHVLPLGPACATR